MNGVKIQYSNWIPLWFPLERFEFEKFTSLLVENQYEFDIIGFEDTFVKVRILNLFASSIHPPYIGWYGDNLEEYKKYMNYPVEVNLYKQGLTIIRIIGDFPSDKKEYKAAIDEFGGFLVALWELIRKEFHVHISEILENKGFGYFSKSFLEPAESLKCMIDSSHEGLIRIFRDAELEVDKTLQKLEGSLLEVYQPGSTPGINPEWKYNLFFVSKRIRCLSGFNIYSDFIIKQLCASHNVKPEKIEGLSSSLNYYLSVCDARCSNLAGWRV